VIKLGAVTVLSQSFQNQPAAALFKQVNVTVTLKTLTKHKVEA